MTRPVTVQFAVTVPEESFQCSTVWELDAWCESLVYSVRVLMYSVGVWCTVCYIQYALASCADMTRASARCRSQTADIEDSSLYVIHIHLSLLSLCPLTLYVY